MAGWGAGLPWAFWGRQAVQGVLNIELGKWIFSWTAAPFTIAGQSRSP